MPPDPTNPRAVMMMCFYTALGAALASQDIGAARVATGALGALLEAATCPGEGAPVVDLAHERQKRGR